MTARFLVRFAGYPWVWTVGCMWLGTMAAAATEWPQYRGANHDGISTDRLNRQWTGSVTNPLWQVLIPNSIGSFAVANGRAYTLLRRNIDGEEKEVCLGLSITNGMELWATPVDIAEYPDGGVGLDDGPRSTPAAVGDSVYVLSSYIHLYRLNAATGGIIWHKDLQTIYGGSVIAWQNAASPVIEDGLIYVNANCGSQTLMALRTSDGEPAWRSQNEGMTHATPTVATIHGVRQVIFATQSGLVSLNSLTGALLWKHAYPFFYSISLGASPVAYQDMVFVTGAHAYGMGTVTIRADLTNSTWSTTRLWSTNNPASHWMTPVVHQGFLYGQFGIQSFDSWNAQLKCIDMRTGTVQWSINGFGRGATILMDNQLLALTERGDLVLVQPNTNAYTELARFQAIPDYHDFTNKCWNSPAVADGRVYVRSTSYGAAFDLSVPDLKLDKPQVATNKLQLTVRTANGSPISPGRASAIELRSSTNFSQPPATWLKLTNTLALTNGVVRVNNIDIGPNARRFFIISEPK